MASAALFEINSNLAPFAEKRELVELSRKAEAGDPEAQYKLAGMYSEGRGVGKDLGKAAEWMKKSAEQGYAGAFLPLGQMYHEGIGMLKDLSKAADWYGKAVEQGSSIAMNNLAVLYSNGEGVRKDLEIAADLYKQAAEKGQAVAQGNLASVYENGQGLPKDLRLAADWYRKAAEQGDSNAQYKLGIMHIRGQGVDADKNRAIEWITKAADQGNADAQDWLGTIYLFGTDVPKDTTKSFEWFSKAASQGTSNAQYWVGFMYSAGLGVPRDRILAYAWSNLAAAKGQERAKSIRDPLVLTPAERAEAERLSTNWKPGQTLARDGSGSSATHGTGQLSKQGNATAFVVSQQGHAITNHHVANDCKELRAEGQQGSVKLITTDAANDLALLLLPRPLPSTATLDSDPAKLRQGEDIVVFGFPLNTVLSSGGNLTPGVVSALTGFGNNTNQIQITAPIQPGSSGSPIMNRKGRVVGIVSTKLSDKQMATATGQVAQTVNFAVNGQTLRTFLDTHQVPYHSSGGWLAFEKSTADLADEARKWTLVIECWK